MKSFLVVLFLLPFVGSAQFNKGALFIGGSASFIDQNSQGNVAPGVQTGYNSFYVGPKIGYFVSDKWAIGGSLVYNAQQSSSSPYAAAPNVMVTASGNLWALSAGAFARRYFAISDKFLFAIEGGFNFSHSNYTYTNKMVSPLTTTVATSNEPMYSYGATLLPLFVFFPTPRWGLEAGIGSLALSHSRYLPNGIGQNNINLSISSSTSFGVYYYFRRH